MREIRYLLLAVLLAACKSESVTPSAVAGAQLPSDDVIYGLHHVMTKAGVQTGVLDGDTAYLRESGQKFDLRGVRLRFFNASGAESGTLTAKTGEYSTGTGSFVARGNAVLVTQGPNGTRRVVTDELHYDTKTDQLWSDKPFVMTEGGRETRGRNFRSDSKFQTFSVSGARTSGGLPQAPGSSEISF